MQNITSLFSLLFFTLIFIYLYFGLYIIKLDKKASINRVYLATCISMSIWSFGFGMANIGQTLETVLFWRRVSAIGWATIYSLMLHFFLLLSQKNRMLKKRFLLNIVHIPALVSLFVFSLSNRLAQVQYNIVKIDYGWINKSVNNGWDWFFNGYYISYIVLSILAIWKWQHDIKNERVTKQAKVIVLALFLGMLLGTLTDLVISSMGLSRWPQIAPLFILLPVWAMYYSARYYGVINLEKKPNIEIIVNDEDMKKMFYYITIAFILGGILKFISEYTQYIHNSGNNLSLGIIKSMLLIGTGAIIYVIQRIKKKASREFLTILVLVISVPMITFSFLEYSSVTVWVFPIIIIIASLIFSKRALLVSTTISAVMTQIIIWILIPKQEVLVDNYDYMLRIGLLITAFAVGTYVNNIYVKKIKENDYQIKFKNMHSEVSSDFLIINKENADTKIDNLLLEIGSFFKADRTYLFMINQEKDTIIYSNEWSNNDKNKRLDKLNELPLEKFSWWLKEFEKNKFVYIDDVSKMPEHVTEEKQQLIDQNIKSIISVPVEGSEGLQGYIGIDLAVSSKKKTMEDIGLINILANLLADGLTKLKAEDQINFMAYYDNLTKLPNRFLFYDRVNRGISLSKNKDTLISVIFLDLDNFKSVNDTIGHKGGDYLLQEVARNLERTVGKTNTVSRFGGDEFMIMLKNVRDYKAITDIVERIMALFQHTFEVEDQEFKITASAGISIYPVDGKNAIELIKNADTAMYKAKIKGKNQYALCTADMKEEVQESLKLSNDLFKALERDELVVYYQPQIDLSDGSINGLEALLRWNHPERGMIAPREFIPIAEKNGTINKIGEWVLKTSCMQNKKWQDMGLPQLLMAVNLSPIQFINPRIAENIASILAETKLEPKYLELEITESMAIKEVSYVEDVLNKLKNIGISIAIDDFGTEYSSLSRLKELPIDRIKIDMQFTQGIELNEKDRAITMVIINLAKSLGLNVLAEGVETSQQMDYLNQKLCDDVQGFFYYKPMPAEEVEKILMTKTKER